MIKFLQKKMLLSAIAMVLMVSSFAQSVVKGRLLTKGSEKAVADAFVMLTDNGVPLYRATTNENGEFQFNEVKKGAYVFISDNTGYLFYSANVNVDGDLTIDDILLSSKSIELEDIEVIGRKRQTIYRLDKKSIAASSNLMASGGGGTATDILAKVPSMRLDSEGELTFRGSSGFTILVNGKPSPFEGSQALQQIPANQIENIEIITTPSAKNQSDGDAGVINIITKQDYGEGVSGAVNIFGSTIGGRGANVMVGNKFGKHQVNIGLNYSDRLTSSDFEQEKSTVVNGVTTTSHSQGERKGNYYSRTVEAMWQFDTPKTNLYIDLITGYEGKTREGDLAYTEKISSDKDGVSSDNNYNNKDYYDLHETLASVTGGFSHKFNERGDNLTGSVYAKYGGNALEYFKSDLFAVVDGAREHGHQAWESEHRWTIDAKLDYQLNYSPNGRFEAGYQYYSYLEDGDYTMEYWNQELQQFEYRDDIYNTFFFKRATNTIYALVNQAVGNFEFQAGLRGEHTNDILKSSQTWADRNKKRFELFPSIHAAYSVNERSTISAAYSKRTNRPRLFFMEPYITFRDYYTAEKGNPDIRAEYINNFELSLKKEIKNGTIQAALFHRTRKDKIERLRVTYTAGITLDSMANVGSDYSTGAEFGVNYKCNRVWSFVLNGSVYRYELKNKLPELGGSDEQSLNYDFMMSNSFNISKNSDIQLDATYVGPTVQTQGGQDSYFFSDLAYRHKFFDGRIVADVSFKNFLNTAKYVSRIETVDLRSFTTILPKFPQITLGLSYTFNNFKQKASKESSVEMFEGTNY